MAGNYKQADDEQMKVYTEMIIEQLEAMERSNWQKPWVSSHFKGGPKNMSGRPYSGINPFLLSLHCQVHGYTTPVFMTFKQAKEKGLTIQKGEHGFPVSLWKRLINDKDGKRISEDEYNNLPQDERRECRVGGFPKRYTVFNVEQTNIKEVAPELWDKIRSDWVTQEELKDENNMFKSLELDWMLKNQKWICPINPVQGDRAFYSKVTDSITVPLKSQFIDGESFYTTLLHEMVHSTGTEDRLKRDLGGGFGSSRYGREELVAELGAALSGIELGISKTIKEESKQYLKGWLENLRKDPKFLESVFEDTRKAVRMVHEKVMTEEMQEAIKNETLESIGAFIDEKNAEAENRKPTLKADEITTSIRPKTEESNQGEEQKTGEQTYYIRSRTIHDIDEMKPLMELHDAALFEAMGDQAIGTETADWINSFIYAEPQMDLNRRDADVLRETETNAAVFYNETGVPHIDVYHKVPESFLRSQLREWDVLNAIVANKTVTGLAVRMAGEEVAAHPEIPRTVNVAEGEDLQWRFNGENGHIEMGLDTDRGFETLYSRGVDLTRSLTVTIEDLREIAADDARIRLEHKDYLADLANDLNSGWVSFEDVARVMERDGIVPYEMTPRQTQVLLYKFLSDELRRQDPAYDGSKEYEQWKADKERLQANLGKADALDGYSLRNGDRWTLGNGDRVQWKYSPYTDRISIGHDNGYFFVKEMEFPVDNAKEIVHNLEDIRSEVMQHYSRGNSLLPDLAEGINSGRLTFVEAGDILQRTGHYPWHPSTEETKAYLHDMLRPELQGNVALDELAARNRGWNRMEKDGVTYTFDFNSVDEGWVNVTGEKEGKTLLNETMPLGVLTPQGERSGLEELKEEAYILAEWQTALRGNSQYPEYSREWNVNHKREIVLPDFTVVGFERGTDDRGADALSMGPVDGRGNVQQRLVHPTDGMNLSATSIGQLADKALLREFAIAHAEELKQTIGTGQALSRTDGEQVREEIPMLRDYYQFKEKHPDTFLLFGNRYKDRYTVFQQDAETIASRQDLGTVKSNDLTDREGKPLQVLQFTSSELDRIVSDSVRNDHRVAILDLDPEIEQMVKDFVAAGQRLSEEVQAAQTGGKETEQETLYYASVAYLQGDTDTARLDELKEAGRWDELLAEAAEYDQGEAVNLEVTYLNAEQYKGDNLLDENEHYAVVNNNAVGGTYNILRKVPESEVWNIVHRYGLTGRETQDVVEMTRRMANASYEAVKDQPHVLELANGETIDWKFEEEFDIDYPKILIHAGEYDETTDEYQYTFGYLLDMTLEENLESMRDKINGQLEQQKAETQAGQVQEPTWYTKILHFGTEKAARLDGMFREGKTADMLDYARQLDQPEKREYLDLEETYRNVTDKVDRTLIAEDDNYALVQDGMYFRPKDAVNENTYSLYLKSPESKIWEVIQRDGGVNGGWCTSDVYNLAVKRMAEGYDAIKDRPQVIELSNGETRDWALKENRDHGYSIQVGRMGEDGLAVEREICYDLEKTFTGNLAFIKEELEEELAEKQAEGQTVTEGKAGEETLTVGGTPATEEAGLQPGQAQTGQQTDNPEIEFRPERNRVEVFVNRTQLGTITYDREWQPAQGADEALLNHPAVSGAVEEMRTRGNRKLFDKELNAIEVALKPLNPPSLVYDNPKVSAKRTMLAVEQMDGQQVAVAEQRKQDVHVLSDGKESPRAYLLLEGEALQQAMDGKNPNIREATPENLTQMDERADRYLRAFAQRYWQALTFGDREQVSRAESRFRSALAYKYQEMDYGEFCTLENRCKQQIAEMAKQDKWMMGRTATPTTSVFEVYIKKEGSRTFQPYNVQVDLPMTKKEALQHNPDVYGRGELPYLAGYMDGKVREKGYEAYQLRDTDGKVLYDSRRNEGRLTRLSPAWREAAARPQELRFEALAAGVGVAVSVQSWPEKPAQMFIHPDRHIDRLVHYPLSAESSRQIAEFAATGNLLRPDITDRKVLMFEPVNEPTKIYDNVHQLRLTPVSVEEVNGVRMAVTRQGEVLAEGDEVDLLPDHTRENFRAINEKADRYLKGYADRITSAVLAGDEEGVRKQAENFIRILKYQQQDSFDYEEAEDLVGEIVQGAWAVTSERTEARVREGAATNTRDRIRVFGLRDGVHLGICVVRDGERSATRRLSDEESRIYREMAAGGKEDYKRQLADKYIYSQERVHALPAVAPEIRGRITEATLMPKAEGQPYMIRAKIDGVQQMAKPVGKEDLDAYFQGLKGQPKEVVDERRVRLAALCFREELQSADRDLEKGLHR